MKRFVATIVIEANSEAEAEEQLQAEPFRFVQNASISPYTDARLGSVESLSKFSHIGLTDRLVGVLDSLYEGGYYSRFSEIAKERGRKIESSHFSRMDTASLQLLIETIESLSGSPELREARLVAEEILKVLSVNGPAVLATQEGSSFVEDIREFIGSKLDLTDAALLEAWETIEQDRMKKEAGADVRLQ